MPRRAHRRLRLPADHRSPAAARAAVREVLLAGGWAERLDEALLLVSELSTNGVVHAGTAFDVDVLTDEHGVTITVSDQKVGLVGSPTGGRGGPFEVTAARTWGHVNGFGGVEPRSESDPDEGLESIWVDGEELEERGRGLLLVDQLASSWGTSHYATGKSVWFRLGHQESPPGEPAADPDGTGEAAGEALRPVRLVDDSGPVTPAACVWLVHVPEGLRSRLTMPALVSELLVRLCEVAGAAAGGVWLDRGDGLGERRLALHESPAGPVEVRPAAAEGALVVPLPVHRPLRGSLVLQAIEGRPSGRYWPELAALSAQRMAIAIDAERLQSDDLRRRGWLTFLAEASELLANSLDVDLTLALVPQIVVPRLGDWCAVYSLDVRRAELRLAHVQSSDENRVPELKRLLQPGDGAAPGLLGRLADGLRDEATITLTGEVEGVAVPLSARGNILGMLAVGRHPDRLHGADDIAVIEDVARRASLAIDNARAHGERTQIAQDLQRALLPQALPVSPGVEFGAEYVPASTGSEVGGDFYDVVQLGRNRWLVSIGDVCGKGTQAAAVTGVVRDVVRALVGDNRSLPRMLRALNRTLLEQENSDRYCTLATAIVTKRDGAGGSRLLDVQLCLAGHDRPVMLRRDGSTQPVGECGTAVGLLEEIEVSEVRVTLRPGESLVFFTDGVTERRHGPEMYGTRRLRRELRGLLAQSAQTMAARVREDVMAYSPETPRDDIAVLVLRNPE
jgi:sigma-B regulation protein RsbU (phosphoserine phosphatase)